MTHPMTRVVTLTLLYLILFVVRVSAVPQYAISLIHLRFMDQPVSFQVIGSTIWVFGFQATSFSSGFPIAGLPIVYSSVDGGATWVEADPTHRPNNQGGNIGFANTGGKQIYDPIRGKFLFVNSFVETPTLTQATLAFWTFDIGSGLYDNGGVTNTLSFNNTLPGAGQGNASLAALTYFTDGSYVLMLQNISTFESTGASAHGSPIAQFRSTDGGVTWGSFTIITTTPASNTLPEPYPHYNVVSIIPTSATDYVGLLAIISQPDGSGGKADPMYYVIGNNVTGVSSYTLIPGTNVTYTQSAFQQQFTGAQPNAVYCGGTLFGGNAYFSLNYSDDLGVTYSPGVLKVTAGPVFTFTKISPNPNVFTNTGISLNHLGNPITAYGFDSNSSGTANTANTSLLSGGVWGATTSVMTPPDYGAAPPLFNDYGTPHGFYDVSFPVTFTGVGGSTDLTGLLTKIGFSVGYYPGVVLPFSIPPPVGGTVGQLVLQ